MLLRAVLGVAVDGASAAGCIIFYWQSIVCTSTDAAQDARGVVLFKAISNHSVLLLT